MNLLVSRGALKLKQKFNITAINETNSNNKRIKATRIKTTNDTITTNETITANGTTTTHQLNNN